VKECSLGTSAKKLFIGTSEHHLLLLFLALAFLEVVDQDVVHTSLVDLEVEVEDNSSFALDLKGRDSHNSPSVVVVVEEEDIVLEVDIALLLEEEDFGST
jgi:hypothetical protein